MHSLVSTQGSWEQYYRGFCFQSGCLVNHGSSAPREAISLPSWLRHSKGSSTNVAPGTYLGLFWLDLLSSLYLWVPGTAKADWPFSHQFHQLSLTSVESFVLSAKQFSPPLYWEHLFVPFQSSTELYLFEATTLPDGLARFPSDKYLRT